MLVVRLQIGDHGPVGRRQDEGPLIEVEVVGVGQPQDDRCDDHRSGADDQRCVGNAYGRDGHVVGAVATPTVGRGGTAMYTNQSASPMRMGSGLSGQASSPPIATTSSH